MRESVCTYTCENKSPDQLSGSRTADQRLSFSYINNTYTLLHESEISNLRPSSLSVSVTSNTGFLATRLKYTLGDDQKLIDSIKEGTSR